MQVTTNPDIVLRDYQRETLESIRRGYDSGVNRQLVSQATGLGKTITFAHLPAFFPELVRYGMVVVVHTTELAYQAQDSLQWVCPSLRVDLEKAEYSADPTADIIVTSRQTLGRTRSRLNRLMKHRQIGIVVTDEAHHVKPGGTYDNILSPLGLGTDDAYDDLLPNDQPRLSVGVTATPNRNDGIALNYFYGQIASNYDLQWGIENGYLADVRALQVNTNQHIDEVTSRAGDFAVGELSNATNTPERNQVIVEGWRQYCGDSSIAFCVDVAHAHDLAEQFRESGVAAVAVDGKTPKGERDKIIEQYKDGTIQVVTNCMVLTEGFDAPGTQSILMARPTQSTPLYIQMLGRGTRTMPPSIGNLDTKPERLQAIEESDKPYMTLIDFADLIGDHDIVRAPDLFGMSSDFDSTSLDNETPARMVQDVVPKVEEIVEENPFKEEEIRDAASIEEMEVEADEITVFDVANPSDDIKDVSEYRWMDMGQGVYQLSVPADRQFDVRVEQDMLGDWEVSFHYPTQYVEQDGSRKKIKGATYNPDVTYGSLEDAIGKIDKRITDEHGDIRKIMKHTARWHSGQATSGQKGFLDRLGVDYPSNISKGEASALIDAKKALLRREKAEA